MLRSYPQIYAFTYGRTRLVLDSTWGLLNQVKPNREMLILTRSQVIQFTSKFGKRFSQSVNLHHVRKIELFTRDRAADQLFKAFMFLGLGALLGTLSWVVFDAFLLSIFFGGIPLLAGLNMLLEYGFPDKLGEFRISAVGVTIRFPLKSEQARDGSHILGECLRQAIGDVLGYLQGTADQGRKTYEAVKRKDEKKALRFRLSMGQFHFDAKKRTGQTLRVRSPIIHKKPGRWVLTHHLRSRRHLELDSHQS